MLFDCLPVHLLHEAERVQEKGQSRPFQVLCKLKKLI